MTATKYPMWTGMLMALVVLLLMGVRTAQAELAEVSYTSVGSSTYAVPFEYIDTDHVSVSVDGVDVTFTWDDPATVRPDVTPATDQIVRVYRETPIDDAVVTFSRGVRMTANRLNKAINQALYVAQEIEDDKDQANTTIASNVTSITDHEARITAEEDYTVISNSTLADLLVRVTAVEAVIDAASAETGNQTLPINDVTPPSAPTGLYLQSSGDGFVSLQWTANTEADLSHYEVGRALTGDTAYVVINTNDITGSAYVDSTAVNDTAYDYVVRAYDVKENASDWSAVLMATATAPVDPGTVDLKFDFGTSSSVTETDYTKITDSTAYTIPLGYGWSAGSINDKDRSPTEANTVPDLNTDMNRSDDGTFSVTLPNGTYDVTWGIGDPGSGYVDSGYYLEGTLVHEQSSLSAQQFVTIAKTVTVSDGVLDFRMALTASPSASINVPINWMTIVDNPTGTPSPPYSGGGDDPPGTAPPDANGFAGMGLHEVKYWSAQIPFKNVMMQSKEEWVISGGSATYDGNNWPILTGGATAWTIMLNELNGAYPSGDYQITWDGTGTVSISGDGTASDNDGSMTCSVTAANAGLTVTISNSGPVDHVRNIKVILPGEDEATGSFNPDFLGSLAPFGTIRFMDWQRTNGSPLVEWSDMNGPTHSTQGTRQGVAIELMVELANTLECDVWFCMPHQASDDYITQFATYVRDNLHAAGNVYVEYSNEVWNGAPGFDQHGWVISQSGDSLFSDGHFAKWGERAKNTFDIWTAVWTEGTDLSGRLVRVAAGHQANVWVTENLCDELGTSFDAISCSGYMRPDFDAYTSSTTEANMLSLLATYISTDVQGFVNDHDSLRDSYASAQSRTIRLVAYEAGQEFIANHFEIIGLGLQSEVLGIQDDPLMGTRYDELMDVHYNTTADNKFDLLVFFQDTKRPDNNGAWGHLTRQDGWQTTPVDYLNANEQVKYKAILDWTPNP